jgi:hypothetical protein
VSRTASLVPEPCAAQGASATALIVSGVPELEALLGPAPHFKFAVLIGGFLPRDPIYTAKIKVDTHTNRNVRDFGCEMSSHAAVSRRPPISLSTIVARTHMYTYAAKVWDLSLVQGPFSVAPCHTLTLRGCRPGGPPAAPSTSWARRTSS